MLESSKDILYLVIAFCVLWATVFLCWMLYYVMRILKNTNQIVEEFRIKLQTLSEAVSSVRDRVEQMSGIIGMLSGGLSGAVKKAVSNKAKDMVDTGTVRFNRAAKDAVDRAVAATADKMKKATQRIKK